MFSGIIETIGTVRSVETTPDEKRVTLATGLPDLMLGESIAVNGVCLTVTRFTAAGDADFFISTESLSRTALGTLAAGGIVNLERAVTPQTRLSGHIVQGHVDGLATLQSVVPSGDAYALTFSAPRATGRYLVEKGSVAIDGISLTVNFVEDRDESTVFGITIIPHTWAHTTLGTLREGARVNVEVDIIAKYVERLCSKS